MGNNSATLQNGTGFGPGHVGDAFVFDGVDDYAVISNPSLQGGADGSFSLDFWLRTSFSTTVNQGFIVHAPTYNENTMQVLLSGAEVPYAGCQTQNGSGSLVAWPNHIAIMLMRASTTTASPALVLCSDTPMTDGAYHHVAVSFDGASRTLTGYFDGQASGFLGTDCDGNPAGTLVAPGQVHDGTFPGVNWALPVYFGTTYGRSFPLELDEIDFFNRALSQAEVRGIVGAGSAGKCHPSLQETITVPVDGSVRTSTTTLQAGVAYQIRASGTFFIGGPGDGLADAEYANFLAPQDTCTGGGFDLGIGINSSGNTPTKFPFWGTYVVTHVYTINFVGQGQPITLLYHDCGPSDNSGSLTVEIFRN